MVTPKNAAHIQPGEAGFRFSDKSWLAARRAARQAAEDDAALTNCPSCGEEHTDEEVCRPMTEPSHSAASDSGVCVRCIKVGPFDPCCSSHDAPLCHRCYRLTHFVEVCGCQQCVRDGLPKILGERERWGVRKPKESITKATIRLMPGLAKRLGLVR